MNDTDSLLRSISGLTGGTLRILTVVCAIAVGLLYLYRLRTVVHCMRQPVGEFPAATDRIIWVGLAMLIPLGLGAVLYDIVRHGRIPLRFIIPFLTVAVCLLWFFIPMFPRATKFSFDFLGI